VAGAGATLSGFATPALSGGVWARATLAIINAAASNIHDVNPIDREANPAFIALSP
jgi:hypothetical protein